jgi:hypothetical protein
MFQGLVYAPNANNSLVTLSGLTPGQQYELEFLLVEDENSTHTISLTNEPTGGTVYTYDYSQNAVQLVTCSFFADSTAQKFNMGDTGGGNNNAYVNAYQLRAVPEPGAWASLLGGCGVLLGLRRRRY